MTFQINSVAFSIFVFILLPDKMLAAVVTAEAGVTVDAISCLNDSSCALNRIMNDIS
jgi:hypothetical protein